MANDDNDPRRHRDRLEDNPFIAFRRFADSQVSSLLNTVFTIPATIANYNNVHQAREACLFKKADQTQCDKLQDLEHDIASLRHEGRELYRTGHLQDVLKMSEELMKLDRQADELRKDIVGQSKDVAHFESDQELVQRVANKKGQEWGWDWSWGFPKAFDDESQSSTDRQSEMQQYSNQRRESLEQLKLEARRLFGEEAWDSAAHDVLDAMDSNPMFRAMFGDKAWEETRKMLEDVAEDSKSRGDRSEQRPRWRTFHFPAPADARSLESHPNYSPRALDADENMRKTGVNWEEAYNDLVHGGHDKAKSTSCPWRSRRRAMASGSERALWEGDEMSDEPSYEYSHDHEDQHDDPPTPQVKQGEFAPSHNGSSQDTQSRAAQEHSQIQSYLSQQQEQNNRQLGLLNTYDKTWAPHSDEQPAQTELDAYEHHFNQLKESNSTSTTHSSTLGAANDAKPSILSTLTTTERTVAPDGSVTTKTILKKRFADGREENSETVHTQRGDESHKLRGAPAFPYHAPGNTKEEEKPASRGSGWFWSS